MYPLLCFKCCSNGGAPHHLQNHGGNNGGQMPSGSSSNYHSTDRDLQQPGGYGNSLPAKYSEGVYGPGLPGAPGAASGAGNGSAHTPVFPNPHQHKGMHNEAPSLYSSVFHYGYVMMRDLIL